VARRPIRTFLDSGVLIAAFKGQPSIGDPAAQILKDTNRVFLSSPFVHLEVCPKALFNRQREEHDFYQRYFARAEMTHNLKAVLTIGTAEGARSGVGPMDSLHLAAARLLRADQFITTEKPKKSIHRSSLVKIVYLFS
jgi:predicted nucleic acid-binding protein